MGENPTPLLNIIIEVGGKKSIQREESSSIAFLIPRDAYDGHNGWTLALAFKQMQLNGPQTKQTSKWQSIYRSLCSFLLEIARLLGMGQKLVSPEKVSLCSGAPEKCEH